MDKLIIIIGFYGFLGLSCILATAIWFLCMGCIKQGIDPLKPMKDALSESYRKLRVSTPDVLYAIRNKEGEFLNNWGAALPLWTTSIGGNVSTVEKAREVRKSLIAASPCLRVSADDVEIVEVGYKVLRKVK